LHFNILGFLPRDTAKHHQQHVLGILREALDEAKVKPEDIDVVCYTKGEIEMLLKIYTAFILITFYILCNLCYHSNHTQMYQHINKVKRH